MNGMTITERMMPAVSTPMPLGAPWNSGPKIHRSPNRRVSVGWTYVPNIGANTNNPHMP
jgi:hypothetical protein